MISKRVLVLLAVVASPAMAQISVDGSVDSMYGSPISVQTVQTQFGDSMNGASGGELDALYATVDGGRLYVMLAGNQEGNFNKMDIFIDSVAGGENQLTGTPQYDFSGDGTNWISSNLSGLKFDAGFEADYHLFGRHGGSDYEFDIVNRAGGTSASVSGDSGTGSSTGATVNAGSIMPGAGGNNTTTFLSQSVDFAFDNSNNAGVTGGCDPLDAAGTAAAEAVTTGLEFSVALADIGNPTEIKLVAMYNNGDHNYLSNQMLPGLTGPQCNLGSDGNGNGGSDLSGIDLSTLSGTQFAVISVPEMSSVSLLLVGLLGLIRRRK